LVKKATNYKDKVDFHMPFNALNRDSEINYICKAIRPTKNDKKTKEKTNVRRNTNSSRNKRNF